MSNNELLQKIETLQKLNSQLLKREKILKHRLAHIMWLQFTDQLNLDKEALKEELHKLDEAGESHLELETESLHQNVMYLNDSWFVNTQLEEFLSKFT